MDFKNTLRKEIEDKLLLLEDKKILSEKITENIINSELWNNANKIFLYISFKNEVDTTKLIYECKKAKKMVYAPIIKGNKMDFFRIDNLEEQDFVINRFGIPEPPKDLEVSYPSEKCLMIIPGLGFSINGSRLGRGGGFYDRYLSENPDIIKVAVAFNIQICNKIPTEEWDKKVDYIITESNIYTTGV